MSLFGSIGSAIKSVYNGATSLLSSGTTTDLGNSVGNLLNGVTGVNSSAEQAQKYTQQNMATSQGMTLEQMAKSNDYYLQQLAQNYAYEVNSAKNAIQWQMQDLKKAGLNPILAAGYGGANLNGAVGASGVSGGASAPGGATGSRGGSPMEIFNALNSAKQVDSQAQLNKAIEEKTLTEAGLMPQSAKATIRKQNAETVLAQRQAQTESEMTRKVRNEAWESIHRSQKYDAEREYTNKKATGKNFNFKIDKNGFGAGGTW